MNNLIPFCPRCRGKMARIKDLFGDYDDCINCGNHKDVFIGPPVALKPGEIPGKKSTRRASRGPSIGGNPL